MNDTWPGKPSAVLTALSRTAIVLEPGVVSHPHKVADSCLHGGHGRTEIGNRFAINFPLLVHDDQVRYLLSHRLQDTLNGFGVKHRHRGIAPILHSNWQKTGHHSGSQSTQCSLQGQPSDPCSPQACPRHAVIMKSPGHHSSTHRRLLRRSAPPQSPIQRTTRAEKNPSSYQPIRTEASAPGRSSDWSTLTHPIHPPPQPCQGRQSLTNHVICVVPKHGSGWSYAQRIPYITYG